MNKLQKLASGAVCLLSVLALFLLAMLLAIGPVGSEAAPEGIRLGVAQRYQDEMANRFDQILFGEVAVRKVYTISDTAEAAPEPNQACYGEADTASELTWLLEQAAPLLEGQELFFSTDVQLLPDSKVRYYLDETIFAITWQTVQKGTVFTYSEVKLSHPSQFRRHLGDGFGTWNRATTSQMAKGVNAVVALSGDYYAYRQVGLTITNGFVHKYYPGDRGTLDTCLVTREGDLYLEQGIVFEDEADAQRFADEHDTYFSLSFGPVLVKDGVLLHTSYYPVGELDMEYPRAAICQMGKLHYLGAVCNKDRFHDGMLNMEDFAQCIYETGCQQAYTLDGGQTATVVMNDQVVNTVNFGSERPISDIIYFATALPSEG